MIEDLQKSEFMADWYVVEGSDFGQPEGTAAEWREVIALMKTGTSGAPGRRVEVTMHQSGQADLYSPRNAWDEHDCANLWAADVPHWIAAAEALLAANEETDHSREQRRIRDAQPKVTTAEAYAQARRVLAAAREQDATGN